MAQFALNQNHYPTERQVLPLFAIIEALPVYAKVPTNSASRSRAFWRFSWELA